MGFTSRLKSLITAVFLILFILETFLSCQKIMQAKTIVSLSRQVRPKPLWLDSEFFNFCIQDDGSILYPSVTVCKEYLFDDYNEEDVLNLEGDPLLEFLHDHTWDRDELFYFMTHHEMLNQSFPCTSKEGGTDPGKPCSFPYYISEGELATDCELEYCYTRSSKQDRVN